MVTLPCGDVASRLFGSPCDSFVVIIIRYDVIGVVAKEKVYLFALFVVLTGYCAEPSLWAVKKKIVVSRGVCLFSSCEAGSLLVSLRYSFRGVSVFVVTVGGRRWRKEAIQMAW
jgi:hypothetical protein